MGKVFGDTLQETGFPPAKRGGAAMCQKIYENRAIASELSTDFDDGIEMLVADHFRQLLRNEANGNNTREPLSGNGHIRLDPVNCHLLTELAWFFDPQRNEPIPLWNADALKKMRAPLLGFSHYRVSPAAIPILFDFAWFHDLLMNGESA
jgi:hypothetical protein